MKRLLVLILLAAGCMFGQISIGIRIGPPPEPVAGTERHAAAVAGQF